MWRDRRHSNGSLSHCPLASDSCRVLAAQSAMCLLWLIRQAAAFSHHHCATAPKHKCSTTETDYAVQMWFGDVAVLEEVMSVREVVQANENQRETNL